MPAKAQSEAKKLADIQKLYAQKDIKRGLKLSQQLFSDNPKCAEALAWKAYFFFMKDQTANKDEAIKLLNDAIRLDFKSSKVWKINGIVYKEMQEYPKCLQCYKQSSQLDPSDLMLISELCNLTLYTRKYDEMLSYSLKLVQNNPSSFGIMRYAIALHLSGQTSASLNFTEKYQKNWNKSMNEDENLFRSEFVLFRGLLMIKDGRYNDAISYLQSQKEILRDDITSLEYQLLCYEKLDDKEKMLETIKTLISEYPENGDYFQKLEMVKTGEDLISELKSIKSKYAQVRVLELLPADHPEYEGLMREYLEPLLFKGTPATYMTLKDVHIEGLRVAFKIAKAAVVPISSVPIVNLFCAHVYFREGEYEKCFEELNAGIEHTPTCLELNVWRIKYCLKLGRNEEALKYARELSQADPADRNTNNLFVKVLFANKDVQEAETEASIFAGEEAGKSLLYETQFTTYYNLSGFSHLRLHNLEKAVEMFESTLTTYSEYKKSQYNYIGWGSRKPRALIELIEYMDIIEQDSIFAKAASNLLKIKIDKSEFKESVDLAFRAMSCKNDEVIALCAVVLAKSGYMLPAIKCNKMIQSSQWRFLSSLVIEHEIKSATDLPAVVQEVINEEFTPIQATPSTFTEVFASLMGKWYSGEKEAAETLFARAVSDFNVSYKEALKFYVFTEGKMKPEVIETLKAKYPTFEF